MKRSKLLKLMVLCNGISLKGDIDIDCLFWRFVKGGKVPLHELQCQYKVPEETMWMMVESEIFEIKKSKMFMSKDFL